MLSIGAWEQDENSILAAGRPVPSEYLAEISEPVSSTSAMSMNSGAPRPLSGTATIAWTGSEGEWDDPANWDMDRVPTSFDAVSVPDPDAIVHVSGLVEVHSLDASGILRLESGSLTVKDDSVFSGAVFMAPNTGLVAKDNSFDEDPVCLVR